MRRKRQGPTFQILKIQKLFPFSGKEKEGSTFKILNDQKYSILWEEKDKVQLFKIFKVHTLFLSCVKDSIRGKVQGRTP